MDRLARHERIIDTEYFLYGGVVDVPKIYDADSKHHSERYVKGLGHSSRGRTVTPDSRVVDRIDFAECQWLRDLTSDE